MYEAIQVVPADIGPPGTETEGTGPGPVGTVVFLISAGVVLVAALVLYLRHRRPRD